MTSSEYIGGEIQRVHPGSFSHKAGVRRGDRLVSINGETIRDVIDYQFHCANEIAELSLFRDGSSFNTVIRNDYADIGLVFTSSVFDSVRTCRNGCRFCFIDQLPKGLRKSLYLKDDDFRLSFLYGNFITLNNLDERDLERIVAQRISPLFVSLHTVDPQLRSFLMGADASRGIKALKKIDQAGISTHLQLVLCPGLNDRDEIDRTLNEISRNFSSVASIGCVPVCLLREDVDFRNYYKDEFLDVIERVGRWQELFRREKGTGFVYAADEFYIGAGKEFPPDHEYDGYPQYENGIGIARSFLEEVGKEVSSLGKSKRSHKKRVKIVTGELAEGLMKEFSEELSLIFANEIEVMAIENDLFGKRIAVAGLLPGKAIADSLAREDFDLALIPDCAINGGAFIDDFTTSEMKEIFGDSVEIIKSDGSTMVKRLSDNS